jgi:hypothetical protein
MPIKIEQHTGLERRDAERVQAMAKKALKTEHGLEGRRPTIVALERFHRGSIAEDRRTGKE